jgi:sec-independent protein translocase protein TatC
MAFVHRNEPRSEHPSGDGPDGSMGFLDHLDEFRTRLIRSCIAIGIGMAVAYSFADELSEFVLAPTLRAIPPGTQLQTTKPGEGFAFYLDISLIGGALLASPYVLFQVWRFIAPGLYAKEKRVALPFVAMAVMGTLAGAAFSHYILFPSVMAFFASFDSPHMKFAPRVEDTFTQYKNMMLAMVAVFQVPTLVLFLARFRMVTARFLWHRIQYAILVIFIAAAVLTPSPDPWTQIVMAAPMLAMYVVSIGVAWLAAPRGTTSAPPHPHLRLVVAAGLLDRAQRHRRLAGTGATRWTQR